MRANAVRLLPSSTTAMFIGTPISSALALAPSTIFCAPRMHRPNPVALIFKRRSQNGPERWIVRREGRRSAGLVPVWARPRTYAFAETDCSLMSARAA